MRKIIHLILTVLLLVPCSALQASHQPEFSTAGFFELPNSGREVFSMNPAWRFYKGSVAGAEAISFDDTEWAVVSLPNGIEYLPTEASGCINYQGEVWYRKHFTPADALKGKKLFLHFEAIMGKSKVFVNGRLIKEHFGGYWWLPLPIFQNTTLIVVNQLFINSCLVTKNQRGTKTGQNHGKIKSRTLRPKYPLWNTSVSFAKVQICPLKNEGKSLFLSFTTHFPTIVPQMWLLQTVLTSNGLVCENWVLNFVLHSVGHFQKRELAIEPKICHPYCPILGFVNV